MKYVLVLLKAAILALAISSLAIAEERGYIKRTLINAYGVEKVEMQYLTGNYKAAFQVNNTGPTTISFFNDKTTRDPFTFHASRPNSLAFSPNITYSSTNNLIAGTNNIYLQTDLERHVRDIVGADIALSALNTVSTGFIRRIILEANHIYFFQAHFTLEITNKFTNQFIGFVVFDVFYQSNLCLQEEYNAQQIGAQLNTMTEKYNQCSSNLSTNTTQLNRANRNYSQCLSSLTIKDRRIADLEQLTYGGNNQCSSLLEHKNQEILALKQALNSAVSKNPETDILKSKVTKLQNRVRSLRLKLRNNR